MESDHSGRPPLKKELPKEAQEMSATANNFGVYHQKHPGYLQGKDVIEYTGGVGGPFVGQILNEHRNLLLKHDPRMRSRASALNWLKDRMRTQSGLINGNDVTALGITGPKVKEVLDNAWNAQQAGVFKDKASALEWLKGQNVV